MKPKSPRMGACRTVAAGRLVLAAMALAALALSTGTAGAAVLRVPEDYPTIPGAIDAAAFGDSVLVGPGTWSDTVDRVVHIPGGFPALFTSCGYLKGGISIVGTAGAAATVIDGGGGGNGSVNTLMFVSHLGETCTLHGLTITGGELAAVFAIDAGRLVVRDCKLSGNALAISGSALRVDTCDLVLEDSEVSFNTGAGAVSCLNGDFEMRRCRIEGNQCAGIAGSSGQSIFIDRKTVEDCVFVDNRAPSSILSFTSYDELSVLRNLFLRNVTTAPTSSACLAVYGSFSGGSGGEIRFNTFAYDSTLHADNVGGLLAGYFHGEITNNTFVGCYALDLGYEATGSAVSLYSQTSMTFRDNVLAHNRGQPAVQLQTDFGSFLEHSCNVFWDNSHGAYSAWITPPPPDIVADPLFCDVGVLDFTVHANSPCAPGGSPGCGAIGAWPVGCGMVSIESKSWGQIKALYK